jgi:NAD(P)H-hydrate epimerase
MGNNFISILSTDQLREADQFTIANEPISSTKLMERAAFACFQWIEKHVAMDQNFRVFCGTGNNGGDGLVVAKLLIKNNCLVSVYIVGDRDSGSPDFTFQLAQLKKEPDVIIHTIRLDSEIPNIQATDIVIDALFGSGLNRPIEGVATTLIHTVNESVATVISLDLPSGLFGEDNRGNSFDSVMQATHTLTFERPKLAFLLSDFGEKAGEWHILPIGLSQLFLSKLDTPYSLVTKSHVKSLLKKRAKFTHKGTFGHTLLIAGSYGKMGAAVLSTKAALHSGVGLVTSFIPTCGYDIMQSVCPEAMCLTSTETNFISGKIDVTSYQSIGIGPGIGINPTTTQTIQEILESATCPLVIDADGLNLLAQNIIWLKKLSKNTILTPHPKEFDRLFGKSKTAFDRLNLQLEKSKEHAIYIVLKGAYSSLSTPSGEVFFNSTGNSGMAKGGSGDVLTGMISSLLAQSYSPLEAATIGMYLHGLAGDLAEKKYTQYAMNATQVIDCIPKAFSKLQEMA